MLFKRNTLLVTKFCIELLLLQLNYVLCPCPYAHDDQFYGGLLRDNDVQDNDINYLSSPLSYDTYDTDCHHFVPQPPSISDTNIGHALNEASDRTKQYESFDNQVIAASRVTVPEFLKDMDRNNYYFEAATKYVQKTTCVSKRSATLYLSTLQIDDTQLSPNETKVACEHGNIKQPSCSNKSPYRQLDGTCNNLEMPLDGRAGDCFRRLLPPDYKDGISHLRTSLDGSPLPNARLVSTNLLGQDDIR